MATHLHSLKVKEIITMNVLKTAIEQVQEFGEYQSSFLTNTCKHKGRVDIYKMDKVTKAHIEYDADDNPKSMTFLYGAN